MRNIFLIIFFIMTFIPASQLLAQDDNDDVHNVIIALPEVALLDLESSSSTTIKLSPKAPNEAGQALDFSDQSNSDIWINYSSIVGHKKKPSRDIEVQITSGEVPDGLLLTVVAGEDAGMGDGKMGKPEGPITLNKNAQKIIGGVGSSYTGNGVSKGHQLTYTLAMDEQKGSYAKLDFDESNTLAITYTLTDQ